MQDSYSNIRKIVIIGPESTGKSRLTKDLACYFNTVFVPEYARDFINALNRPYTEFDLLSIAKGQLELEDRCLLNAKNNLLFCDTDLNVIKVWSEHRYKRCDPWITDQIQKRRYDYYLLTSIDLPWEFDPQREHPAHEMRVYFFEWYKNIVQNSGVPWSLVSGIGEYRFSQALNAVNSLIGNINNY